MTIKEGSLYGSKNKMVECGIKKYHIFSLVLVLKDTIQINVFFGKYDKSNKLICLLRLYIDDILITGERTVK